MKEKSSVSKFGKGHWEMSYRPTVMKENSMEVGAAFSPRPSKDRMKTFKPVNDQDT